MKASVLICLGVVLVLSATRATAQGSLTPPGPPGPTFKTLQQVEPRTPITNLPYTINAPGSYYFISNLTAAGAINGITIQSSDVTLDLNGFVLIGIPGSASGIFVSGQLTNVCVHSGTIRGWGSRGINGGSSFHSVFRDLRVSGNTVHGLDVGSGSLVSSCVASGNGNTGINASQGSMVKDCAASSNGTGIMASNRTIVLHCTAIANTNNGIFVGFNSTLTGCTAATNSAMGIRVADGSTINDCVAGANGGVGILALQYSRVHGCTATGNTGAGISTGSGCAISDCTAGNNSSAGIATAAGCTITRCTGSQNTSLGINAGQNSTVQGCAARANISTGIAGGDGSSLEGCTAVGNGSHGISATDGSAVRACTANANAGDGILVNGDGCRIVDNICDGNGTVGAGAGIHANGGTGHRIDGNTMTVNDYGIKVDGSGGNLIIRNSARGNTLANYSIVAGNSVGVTVLAPVSIAINGDTGGAGVGTTNPWANITFP